MARFGRGLPAHVIPVQINEPSQIGPEIMAAALAWGAGGVRVLAQDRPAHPLDGLTNTLDLMGAICAAMGLHDESCALVQTDDPDVLETALWQKATDARAARSSFLPPEDKRGLLTLAMEELNRTAPSPAAHRPAKSCTLWQRAAEPRQLHALPVVRGRLPHRGAWRQP